jgi:photosystem II stability/assembly factor-like uncharacterized protein
VSSPWQLVSERPGGSVASLLACGDDVLALSAAAVHCSVDGGLSWSTLSAGQPSPPLYALGRTERSLFVGGAGGLFRSRDRGRSWRGVLSGAEVTSVAVTADHILLAGTDTDGILRSEDDGETWTSGNPGLLELSVLCLADGFAGTASGLYRSVNGGRSWREVQLANEPVAVECVCASGRIVLAGTDAAGAFVSADAGRTWSPVPVDEPSISALAVDRNQVALAGPGGVYISRDGGQSWEHEAAPEVVLSLVFVARHLLAGVAREGVLRFDGGRYTSSGLNGRVIVDLACTPGGGALLTAGIENGVERSTDSGRTWHSVDGCTGDATKLAVGGDMVYAATSGGLYASIDDGCHWSAVRSDSAAVAVSATSDGLALAAFEDGQLYICRGTTWTPLPWDHGRIVSVGLARDGSMFVACLTDAPVVWRSTDAGRTWSVWLRDIAGANLLLASGEQVLAASGSRIYRLLGATSLPDQVTSITFGPPRRVYAATTGGVYVSTDDAEHFGPWSEGLPNLPVLALHASAHEVLALLFGGSLWRRPL